jgi:hypothetical protein
MKTTGFALAAVLLAVAGCQEPPRTGQMDSLVTGLAHLKEWDPVMQGRGQYAYDAVMGYGPEIYPVLVAHLTDETPTVIHEILADRTAKISDVVFLMLLQMTKMKWQDFSKEGVFLSSALPNPVFCLKWDREAKYKVQARFARIVEEMEKP